MNEAGSSLNLDNWADRQVYWGEKTRKLLFETILKGVVLANRDNFAESEGKYIMKVEDTQFPVTKFQIFNVCQVLTKWMMWQVDLLGKTKPKNVLYKTITLIK